MILFSKRTSPPVGSGFSQKSFPKVIYAFIILKFFPEVIYSTSAACWVPLNILSCYLMGPCSAPVAYMLKWSGWFRKVDTNEGTDSAGSGSFPRLAQLVKGTGQILAQGHLPTRLTAIFAVVYRVLFNIAHCWCEQTHAACQFADSSKGINTQPEAP